MAENNEKRVPVPVTTPEDLADLNDVKVRLEQLTRDSLIYIAGAVNALAADSAVNRPNA